MGESKEQEWGRHIVGGPGRPRVGRREHEGGDKKAGREERAIGGIRREKIIIPRPE